MGGVKYKITKAMNQPFEIKFDFALAHSDLIISMRAIVQCHHSETYYVIDHFHMASSPPQRPEISTIPAQEIKQVERDGHKIWVHRDSERESLLSIAIGKAIEAKLSSDK
jgi:hypothetical protein